MVERDEPGRYDDLLSEEEVERLVCVGRPALSRLSARQGGRAARDARLHGRHPVAPGGFTGTADVDRVLAELERGATIVLQALHLNRPSRRLLPLARADTRPPVPGERVLHASRLGQGLPVHHDTHDVFVLQISGEKRWLVYEPALELPLKDQKYSRGAGGPGPAVHRPRPCGPATCSTSRGAGSTRR